MHVRFLYVLFALIFVCCDITTWGQEAKNPIRTILDSLDKVQPVPCRVVKPSGRTYVIKVKTQDDFDALNDNISKAICKGETNIRVKLGCGMFLFHENHILRRNENKPNVSIIIEGRKKTILTSDKGGANKLSTILNPWQDMEYAEGQIEVINEGKKLCKIPFPNHFSQNERINFTKVQITEWFRAPIYKVQHIDKTGVCFVASDLQTASVSGRSGYNVNYDFLYRQKIPRFRLYDASKECQCNATRAICIERSSYKQITLKNLHFVNNRAGGPLITLYELQTQGVIVAECSFENIRGTVLNASSTPNVIFNKNIVRNTVGDELQFLNNCTNVRVTNCLFDVCGQSVANTFCVNCREATYYIAHNTFRDFGFGAIGVGVWHGFEKKYYSSGIIEHNEICFTPVYFVNALKYMLMDSGALYTWTQNDQVIIRYNYIHDYTGAGDNRGIFCDDGACNVKIYGNVILNIPNCYSIDSRYAKNQYDGFTNNARNFMAYNVVDGNVRFQGYGGEERHCLKGMNYVIRGEKTIESDFDFLEENFEDEEIQDVRSIKRIKIFKRFRYKIKNIE